MNSFLSETIEAIVPELYPIDIKYYTIGTSILGVEKNDRISGYVPSSIGDRLDFQIYHKTSKIVATQEVSFRYDVAIMK